MMNVRNPIAIRTKENSKTAKTSTKHSAAARNASPANTRKAVQTAKSTRNKATASTKSSAAAKVTHSTENKLTNTSTNSVAAGYVPENRHPGLHDRSYAAHLNSGAQAPHTKPAGDLRFIAPFPTGRKQP